LKFTSPKGHVSLFSLEQFLDTVVTERMGSTKSIEGNISTIKREAALRGVPWITFAEEDSLKATMAELFLRDQTASHRKRPLQMREMLQIYYRLDP